MEAALRLRLLGLAPVVLMFLGCLGVDAVGDTAGTEVPNCGSDALVLGSEGAFTHETIDFEFEWGNDVGVSVGPMVTIAVPSDTSSSLDFNRDHTAIISFKNEVDLVVITRSPVAKRVCVWQPRGLLLQLTHHECLQQVPELGERWCITASQLCGRQAHLLSRHGRIHHVHLR